jgi:hypothetical protein
MGLPSYSKVSVAKFAGMFVIGNPIRAMQAMYSNTRGGALERCLMVVKQLGAARSPLVRDELLEALDDPSVDVRAQAIVSILDHRPDQAVTEKMLEILRSNRWDLVYPDLWILERLGEPWALPEIRKSLDAPYPLLRSCAAMSLAGMHDDESAPRSLELFHSDPLGRVEYGEALGLLRYIPAIERCSRPFMILKI